MRITMTVITPSITTRMTPNSTKDPSEKKKGKNNNNKKKK